MIGWPAIERQRAQARFSLGVDAVLSLPDGEQREGRCIVWRDTEEVITDFESVTVSPVIRLNFLIEQVGALPNDTVVELEDGSRYRIVGAPVRERDFEARYTVRQLNDAG